MKYGWYEKIKNAVYYHQMMFNIAFIVEKVLNNNVHLTEKVNVMLARIIRLIK